MQKEASEYEKYLDAVRSNLDSPHPVCLGHLDIVVSKAFEFDGPASKVAALKMFYLSWSSLRSATFLCQAGLISQTVPVLRQSIEAAAYGLLFVLDDDFHKLWKARHEDENAKKKFRNKSFGRALALIETQDKQLSSKIKKNYESLIDFGGHPNPLSVDLISEYHIEPGAEFGMAEYSMILGQPYVDFAVINILGGYSILIDATKIVWPEKWRSEEINRLERRALDSSLSYIRFSSNYEELGK